MLRRESLKQLLILARMFTYPQNDSSRNFVKVAVKWTDAGIYKMTLAVMIRSVCLVYGILFTTYLSFGSFN